MATPDNVLKLKEESGIKMMNVMVLGLKHFPYGYAEIQRAMLLSRAFSEGGSKTCVIAKRSKRAFQDKLANEGNMNGVSYIFTTSIYRNSKILRLILKPSAYFSEIRIIRRKVKSENYHFAFISTNKFGRVLFYFLLSKVLDFRLILNYVEYYTAFQSKNLTQRIGQLLFDKYAPRLSDAVIPISNFILNKVTQINRKIPLLKIPVVCDPQNFVNSRRNNSTDYFCYCGSTNYAEVIEFVLESYLNISGKTGYKLFLILNGPEHLIDELEKKLSVYHESIKIFRKLPDSEYIAMLSNARALLIPLRNTIQDIARFPHKIGEYTATGNPVISTDIGEVSVFFTDKENAFLCSSYEVSGFSKQMEYVIHNSEEAQKVGEAGKKICLKNFDYRSYTQPLQNLLMNL